MSLNINLNSSTSSYFKDSRDKCLEVYKANVYIKSLNELTNGVNKTRSKVFNLVLPIIQSKLIKYSNEYKLKDSMAYAITCIFVSESSNSKGKSAQSNLWLKYNNPFGLTGKGVTFKSWEEINGKRVVKYRAFKRFNTFDDAIVSLMEDYLLNKRYDRLKHSKTVKQFLNDLYKCGYMTGSYWPIFAYNEIYLKRNGE